MKICPAIAIVLALTACQSVPEKPPVPETVDRQPPAEAMVKCPKVQPLEDDTFGAVVRKLHEVLGLYGECSSKRDELDGFIRSGQSSKEEDQR